MARGRFLAATIATDKRLNSVSVEAEYIFLKCIPHLDRDGRILFGDGPELWAKIAPRRQELIPTIAGLVRELVGVGLVVMYDTDEGAVLYFPGFTKNQQGMRYEREAPSRFPPQPDEVQMNSGVSPDKVPTKSPLSVRASASLSASPSVSVSASEPATPTPERPPTMAYSQNQRTDAQKRVMLRFQDTFAQTVWNSERKAAWLDEMTAGAGEDRMNQLIDDLAAEVQAGRLIPYNALGALSERLKASQNGKTAPKKGADRYTLNYDPATVVSGVTQL